jgi:hypothetical protein
MAGGALVSDINQIRNPLDPCSAYPKFGKGGRGIVCEMKSCCGGRSACAWTSIEFGCQCTNPECHKPKEAPVPVPEKEREKVPQKAPDPDAAPDTERNPPGWKPAMERVKEGVVTLLKAAGIIYLATVVIGLIIVCVASGICVGLLARLLAVGVPAAAAAAIILLLKKQGILS